MRTLRFRERMHLADAQNQAQIRLNQEAEYRRAHAAAARRRDLIRLWGRLAGGVLQDNAIDQSVMDATASSSSTGGANRF